MDLINPKSDDNKKENEEEDEEEEEDVDYFQVHEEEVGLLQSYPENIDKEIDLDSVKNPSITDSIKRRTPRTLESKTSQLKCLMNLLKGNIGPGILALPIAFKYSGLWTGAVGILVLGIIALHCMHILVSCSDVLRERTMCSTIGYAGVIENAIATGPPLLRRFQRCGRNIINVFLIITQLGFCCVYFVFVAQNFREVIQGSNDEDPTLDKIIMSCELGVVILYCTLIQSLAGLAYLSVIANFLNLLGLIAVLINVLHDTPDQSTRPAFRNWESLPMYFGTAVYAFEGIGLVMPLKNKVRDEEDFGRRFGLLTLGMTIVVVLYLAIGFFGYLKYGDEVLGSITLNLPPTGLFYRTAKMMFVISVFVSYGLQFYVPVNIIWPYIEIHIKSERGLFWGNIGFRILIILFTFAVAILIPHLDLLIALIGALASSGVAFIFPPILELITFSAEGEKLHWVTAVKDLLILVLGIIGCITGTYAAIQGIVEVMQKE